MSYGTCFHFATAHWHVLCSKLGLYATSGFFRDFDKRDQNQNFQRAAVTFPPRTQFKSRRHECISPRLLSST